MVDLSNAVVLVTRANGGLGSEFVTQLDADDPADVVCAILGGLPNGDSSYR
jgi:hypothetical protein